MLAHQGTALQNFLRARDSYHQYLRRSSLTSDTDVVKRHSTATTSTTLTAFDFDPIIMQTPLYRRFVDKPTSPTCGLGQSARNELNNNLQTRQYLAAEERLRAESSPTASQSLRDKLDGLPVSTDSRTRVAVKYQPSESAGPFLTDGKRSTALYEAALEGDFRIVKLLLDNSADPTARASDGSTALIAAAGEGHVEVAKLLLEKGADVNAQGGQYGNALQAASYWGRDKVVQLLLDKGADSTCRGDDGATASSTLDPFSDAKSEEVSVHLRPTPSGFDGSHNPDSDTVKRQAPAQRHRARAQAQGTTYVSQLDIQSVEAETIIIPKTSSLSLTESETDRWIRHPSLSTVACKYGSYACCSSHY